MTKPAVPSPATTDASSGGRLVTTDGRTLPLRGVSLHADVHAGLGRVRLEQRFVNVYAEPLAVTYLMPLPADGALSGYVFHIGERRIVGEVDRLKVARERYEEAIASGHSAALVEQERSSLFTQQIGNIPPGAEVVAELSIDQRLAWLAEGAWEWRFPTVAMPRYQGEAGRVADAGRVSVDVAEAPLPLRARLTLAIGDRLAAGARPESPSHRLRATGDGQLVLDGEDEGGPRLDRDVVVRWAVAAAAPGLRVATARPPAARPHAGRGYGLVTLVPPAPTASPALAPLPRDLCLLIDTSGSMNGAPLDQARRVLMALVDTLGEADTLEMIEFSTEARRWKRKPVDADAGARADAFTWLRKLHAGGATEMRTALMEALAPLRRESQRQIVLVSDGAIGFEQEIVAELLAALPAGSRLHTVGVGAAVNRSLTQPAARAGRGVEVLVSLGDDAERAARRLCAHLGAPLVVDLELGGSALLEQAPRRLPDLLGAAPLRCAVALRPEGGELTVRGRTRGGTWTERVAIAPLAAGSGDAAVVALFGREAVEDLEMRLCAGEAASELGAAIERIGLEFQIGTRLTSWVAIDEAPAVDPRQPTRRMVIPQELPQGLSVDGLGLRPTAAQAIFAHKTQAVGRGMPRTMSLGGEDRARVTSLEGSVLPPAPAAAAGPAPKASSGGADEQHEKSSSWHSLSGARPASSGGADEKHKKVMQRGSFTGVTTVILRARRAWRRGHELFIEVDLDDAVAWTLPVEAHVTAADGSVTTGAVDAARSTASASLAAGQTLRLVLRCADEPGAAPWTIAADGFLIEVS